MRDIKKVVILGANGAMGSGSGALFAARGFEVVMLARTLEKAQQGLEAAIGAVRADAIGASIELGTYDELEQHLAGADLILEALAEDLGIKRPYFERIDGARAEGSIVATVSSGLSIDQLCEGLSDGLRRHFMGIHLFNPPNVIVGTEMIPGSDTDREVFRAINMFMQKRLGRVTITCQNKPAFAGNRVGFKLLNECCQLALEHGVERIDYLIGPHTGRALPPLATIDLVGWDVHKAIVDNVFANTKDECHADFELPAYMQTLIDAGHLGNKTPAKGGFAHIQRGADGSTTNGVLDPRSGEYVERCEPASYRVGFVEEMKELHRVGRYREGMAVMLNAKGSEADLVRTVILGYLSYGLNRVGPDEVVDRPLDVDLIMAYGFNWAPPSVLVDVMGAGPVVEALVAAGLQVPAVLADLPAGERLFNHARTNVGRFFVGH